MRTIHRLSLEYPAVFKEQILSWANQFREVVYLDSNAYHHHYSSYDLIVAVDAFTAIQTDYHQAFEDLHQYQQQTKDWLFGYLSYDLKNDVESLTSENFDGLHFPDLFFFQPKKLFLLKGNELELRYLRMCDDEMNFDLEQIALQQPIETSKVGIDIQQRIAKQNYLDKVRALQQHIRLGNVYEANFCMEFFAENVAIEPINVYKKINAISEPPFAVYFKNNAHYLMSASPERYLKKEGNQVISQPIKGTAKRYVDATLDEQSRHDLETNPKERSENIMIVDLVRNDLSRTAIKGSVDVQELCGIYSFKQVHQMISTISSEVAFDTSPIALLQTTFPMGSMTGAPKISAMQIIEQLEESKRSLYSGAVGYISPEGDFDFNVVIRSVLYNKDNRYVSFSVGSAITDLSEPEKEYDECMLKAKAMFEVLS